MANVLDYRVVVSRVNSLIAEYPQIEETYGDKKETVALIVLLIMNKFGASFEDAFDSITEGGGDRGVDALYINEEDEVPAIYLIQSKYAKSFDNAKKNYPSDAFNQLRGYIEDLLENNINEETVSNIPLMERSKAAFDILQKARGPKQSLARLETHFIGLKDDFEKSERIRISKYFADKGLKFELTSLFDFSALLKEHERAKIDRELTILGKNYFHQNDRTMRAVIGTISAEELVQFLGSEENPDKVEDSIFEDNVRQYLNKNKKFNKKIMESALSDSNDMFWYQNNGITMTCDKIKQPDVLASPRLNLQNVQIVNGGQTSNCIFEAYSQDPEKVSNVQVLVRIIETDDLDIKARIAESTNSQTPISTRDLHANDEIQKQLEIEFLEKGYYYERKPDQHKEEDGAFRIDAHSIAQDYLAYGVGFPEVAKKDRGRIYSNLYDTIFDPSEIDFEKLMTSRKVMADVNKIRAGVKKKQDGNFESALGEGEYSAWDGTFHIAFATKEIAQRKGADIWIYDEAKEHIPLAYEIVSSLYHKARSLDENFISVNYFKDADTKDSIRIEIEKRLG